MTNDDRDVEAAIIAYRAELLATAALAEAEVAELEDHLRELVAELQRAGAQSATAIAEARRRLGEPREIAAECARVRTAFGTRLSRPRAWSAAVILAGLTGWTAWAWWPVVGVLSLTGAEILLGMILIVGLFARRAWPRAVLLGHSAIMLVSWVVWAQMIDMNSWVLFITPIADAGVIALLVPWRRGELTSASWALVAWSIAYVGASYAVFELNWNEAFWIDVPLTSLTVGQLLPLVSLVGIVLAALGTVLRARWGSMVGFATAAILAVVTFGVLTVENRGALSPSHHAIACAMVAGSFLAGLAAPILAWRGTRPGAGELRSLLLA